MLKFPLKRTYENIMLTDNGSIYSYYKLSPEIISRANLSQKKEYKNKFVSLLDDLVKYKDIHLKMLPKNMNLTERFEILANDYDDNYREVAEYYGREAISLLEQELNQITRYEFYIGVRIDKVYSEMEDIKDTIKNAFNSVTDKIANSLGYDIQTSDKYFNQFETVEKSVFNALRLFEVRRCTEDELNYLIRYNFLGNVKHYVEEESSYRGTSQIANAILDTTEKRLIKIDTENTTVYKSILVLESTDYLMNNLHIFENLQSQGFPLEIDLKFKPVDKATFDLKIGHQIRSKEYEVQDEYLSNSKLKDDTKRNHYLMDRLDNEHSQNKKFVEWILTITLSDTDKDRLLKQVILVKKELKKQNINVLPPVADQLQLFYLMLQGVDLGVYKNWVQTTTTEALSEVLFGVGQKLGMEIGFYLGRIDRFVKSAKLLKDNIYSSRDIVLFHPMIANKGISGAKTDSPHIAITGKTGKGKSFLAKILYIQSLMLNVKTLYFDPKSEMEKWFNQITKNEESRRKYPLFVDLLESIKYLTIDYTKPENFGVLDPVTFLSGAEAIELTNAMFDEVIDLSRNIKVETALMKAISQVVDMKEQGYQVGSLDIIKILQQDEDKDISDTGDNLFEKTQNGMLKLLFYDGSNKTLSLNNKSTILQVYGLDLPNANDSKDTYTDTQGKSLLVMQILGKFMSLFGSNVDEETIIFIDEAWSFSTSKIGKATKKALERIGRSMNNALVFITQSVFDIKDENNVSGNYGSIFAFDEEQEREYILEHLGLENNSVNMDILSNMVKGQCLYKDIYGNVAKLSVHSLFDEWTQAFKTVEKSEVAYAEERFM